MFSRTGNETFEPLSSLGTFRQYDGGSAGSYYNVINILLTAM